MLTLDAAVICHGIKNTLDAFKEISSIANLLIQSQADTPVSLQAFLPMAYISYALQFCGVYILQIFHFCGFLILILRVQAIVSYVSIDV